MQLTRLALGVGVLSLLGSAVPASAELVFLTSGRTMNVKSHVEQGDLIVLKLRTGGEATFDRALIDRIEPDEVPYPEPPPAQPEDVIASEGRPLDAVPFATLIDSLSSAHGVDPGLVKALIKVESDYRVRARSPKGAMGLMQIMPVTARQYSVKNPYDPKANLEAGIAHLAALLSRFEVSVALAAYNAGEAAVRRFNGIPPYPETREYVRRIMSLVSGR
jgi:soluble lytic murein transglycosylase-like protein